MCACVELTPAPGFPSLRLCFDNKVDVIILSLRLVRLTLLSRACLCPLVLGLRYGWAGRAERGYGRIAIAPLCCPAALAPWSSDGASLLGIALFCRERRDESRFLLAWLMWASPLMSVWCVFCREDPWFCVRGGGSTCSCSLCMACFLDTL